MAGRGLRIVHLYFLLENNNSVLLNFCGFYPLNHHILIMKINVYTFDSGPRLRLLLVSDSEFSAIDFLFLYSYIRVSISSKHGASKIRWFRTSIIVRLKTAIHSNKVTPEYIAPYTRKNDESSVV